MYISKKFFIGGFLGVFEELVMKVCIYEINTFLFSATAAHIVR